MYNAFLLTLISATRQAASVYLKNRVHKSYYIDPSRQRPDQIAIPESDRTALKANIFPLIIAEASKSISVQLANTLRSIISHDFPEKWPELANNVKSLLGSSNVREVVAGCTALLEITKIYRQVIQHTSKNYISLICELAIAKILTFLKKL